MGWLKRKDDKASKKLERLMRRDNTYWVEIEGFDEFTAELHDKLGIRLPDTVCDPYKATTERLNRFILPKEKIKNPIIRKDSKELEEQVKNFEQILYGKAAELEVDRLVPYQLLGEGEYRNSNYESALTYYEKALIQNPDDLSIMRGMVRSYWWTEKFDKALEMSERMIRCAPADYRGYWSKGSSLVYLDKLEDAIANYNEALEYTAENSPEQETVLVSRSNAQLLTGDWEGALSDTESALKIKPEGSAATINKCIALKKLNRVDEANSGLQDILPKIEYKYYRAGVFAVLGDKENMLKELAVAIEEDIGNRADAKFAPEFVDYRDDPDFRKLVYEVKE